jgi:hypothetical protein
MALSATKETFIKASFGRDSSKFRSMHIMLIEHYVRPAFANSLFVPLIYITSFRSFIYITSFGSLWRDHGIIIYYMYIFRIFFLKKYYCIFYVQKYLFKYIRESLNL